MTSRSKRGRLWAAGGGMVAALLLWLAFTTVVALRSMAIDAVPPARGTGPPLPVHDDSRPTAVVLLSQAGTEVTDFLAPYEILSAAGAFNLYAVAARADVAPLFGGVGVLPQLTLDQFDAAHPKGADLVVIPNVLDPDNPVLVDWVSRQARRGAVSASICEGARLLARTGLLDGREATTHWAAVDELRRAFPRAQWRNDVRYLADGPIVTSAGVTAALDASLYLVARFAGEAVAERTARSLSLPLRRRLDEPAPALSSGDLTTAALNAFLAWPQVAVRVGLSEGVDEIEVAAALDTYKRTFAATTATTSPGGAAVRSRHGLVLLPTQAGPEEGGTRLEISTAAGATGPAFDRALRAVAARFGGATAALVAAQIQYPAEALDLRAVPSPVLPRLAVFAALLAAGGALGLGMRALWLRRTRRGEGATGTPQAGSHLRRPPTERAPSAAAPDHAGGA